MSLHTSKVQNHNVSTSHFDSYPNPNSPCAHLFILIIFDPISHIYAVHAQRKVYHYAYTQHTPLKHYILYLKHVNTQRKFYQSCRWGVAPPPRRTSGCKQVGRRGALVVACRWSVTGRWVV